jgi:hypothetical protein
LNQVRNAIKFEVATDKTILFFERHSTKKLVQTCFIKNLTDNLMELDNNFLFYMRKVAYCKNTPERSKLQSGIIYIPDQELTAFEKMVVLDEDEESLFNPDVLRKSVFSWVILQYVAGIQKFYSSSVLYHEERGVVVEGPHLCYTIEDSISPINFNVYSEITNVPLLVAEITEQLFKMKNNFDQLEEIVEKSFIGVESELSRTYWFQKKKEQQKLLQLRQIATNYMVSLKTSFEAPLVNLVNQCIPAESRTSFWKTDANVQKVETELKSKNVPIDQFWDKDSFLGGF